MLGATRVLCHITQFITCLSKWGSDPDFYVLKGRKVVCWHRPAMERIAGLDLKIRIQHTRCLSPRHWLKGHSTELQEHLSHFQGGSLPWISAEELPHEFLQLNTGCWSTSLTALALVPFSHISVSLYPAKSSLWAVIKTKMCQIWMIRSNLHYPRQTTHRKNMMGKAAGTAPCSCHF